MMHHSPSCAAEEGNSFWLPHDLNEVIWGTLAFLIVAFLLVKFGKKSWSRGWPSAPTASPRPWARPRRPVRPPRPSASGSRRRSPTPTPRPRASSRRPAQTAELLTVEIADRADTDVVNVRERATADLAVDPHPGPGRPRRRAVPPGARRHREGRRGLARSTPPSSA